MKGVRDHSMTKKQTFEESLGKLEEIIESLEGGELSLEEAFQYYQEGMNLSLFCSKELKKVEQEVLKIQKNHQGSFEITPFQSKGEE